MNVRMRIHFTATFPGILKNVGGGQPGARGSEILTDFSSLPSLFGANIGFHMLAKLDTGHWRVPKQRLLELPN